MSSLEYLPNVFAKEDAADGISFAICAMFVDKANLKTNRYAVDLASDGE
jgi:hypothetical protein